MHEMLREESDPMEEQEGGMVMFVDIDGLVQHARTREPLYRELQGQWRDLMQQPETAHLTLDDFIAVARREHCMTGWEAELVRRRITGIKTDVEFHDQPGGPGFNDGR